jgi:hypothetical protein
MKILARLWTHASRPRFLRVVAAVTAITLAASSPLYAAVRGSLLTAHGSASSIAATGGIRATADCSEATARQLVEQHRLNAFLVQNPVGQLLCGPFTGPGSEAMAITIGGAPTCWPVQRWAVFNFTGGSWQLVLDESEFIFPPLVAVGADIRVTTPVFRNGDPRCIPSGGTHAHTWHWNGTTFTAGPWTQVTPGKALKKEAIVFSPLAYGVSCHMADDGSFRGSWVYCWIGGNPHPARHVKLDINGRFSVSATTPIPLGLGGQSTPYGGQVTAGRFRCQSLRSGIKCTVISTGKGFLFNINGASRVGP